MAFTLNVNGKVHTLPEGTPGDMAVLWALRDILFVNGPKYGCGVDACKACTCIVDGVKQTVCSLSVAAAQGKKIVTIEGLAEMAVLLGLPKGDTGLTKVQEAWLDLDVAQCGFCQAGQIMAAVDLLKRVPQPTDTQINEAMDNVCRCGTYDRIRNAIKKASGQPYNTEYDVKVDPVY